MSKFAKEKGLMGFPHSAQAVVSPRGSVPSLPVCSLSILVLKLLSLQYPGVKEANYTGSI